MVLSNKKLKLKLRSELPQIENNVDNSLKDLSDSAAHKARLSKRQKHRKIRSLQPPPETEAEAEHEGSKKENESEDLGIKKNKKRKRKVVKDHDDVANGVLDDADNNNNKNKNKNKKKKKKKKKAKNLGGEVAEATGLTPATTSRQDKGDVPTKVYVGGIPYYSTEDDIRSYFESCGTITELDCMTFHETGKFRGIAIITFKTEAAAKRALALDGADMGGLFLKIQPYKATRASKASDFAPEILEGYNRIYVGNLSWDITEEELRKFFSNCNITSIRFGMDKETEEFRGYAHVDFSDSQSLKTALTLDQKVLYGRPVRISCAVPSKKKPVTHPSSVATSNSSVATINGLEGEKSSSTGSGKIKRRTCYECGEKGHISSACPKKPSVASTTT